MRHTIATIGLALAVALGAASCTPAEIEAFRAHLEHERATETSEEAVHRAFAERGASPAVQAEAWRVAAGPASCGDTGESGGDPSARNGDHYGLFQIAKRWHEGRAARLGLEWSAVASRAYENAVLAADLYFEQGWRPWSCRP